MDGNGELKIIKCEITGDTTEEEAKEMIEAAFETITQSGGYASYLPPLGGDRDEIPSEVKLKRMKDALDAFSKHPEIFKF